MNIVEYINSTLAKGSIGAYLSVGIIALFAVCALSGLLFGAKRGFSKSVLRIFTVVASAACSLYSVKWICNIVSNAVE